MTFLFFGTDDDKKVRFLNFAIQTFEMKEGDLQSPMVKFRAYCGL